MKRTKLVILTISFSLTVNAQVDFSVVQVNQESGLNFVKVTNDNDQVCMPIVKRSGYIAYSYSRINQTDHTILKNNE